MMSRRKKDSKKYPSSSRGVDNSAKTLLANIRFMRVDDPVKTVVITSAVPNEGKTFISINLARAMATSGVPTLLVDCDMRRRSVARSLNIHAQQGLYSVLSGESSLQEAIVATDTPMLYFLDAEPHIPNPSDLLNSRRFMELMYAAKQHYGYVVFDTPPVGTFVDAAVLGSKVDAVFLVVREQYTRKDAIVRAADQLRTANAPLSGIIMNFCESASSEYYYDYYYYREDRKRNSSGEDERSAEMADFNLPATPLAASDEPNDMIAEPKSWSNAPDLLDATSMGDVYYPADEPLTEESPASEDPHDPTEAFEPVPMIGSSPLPNHKTSGRHYGLGRKVPTFDWGEDASSEETPTMPQEDDR